MTAPLHPMTPAERAWHQAFAARQPVDGNVTAARRATVVVFGVDPAELHLERTRGGGS